MDFIDDVPLSDEVRTNAKAVYSLIAEAESTVHGKPIENIHFHEVGSLDALADVLSVCELMYELAPEKVLASSGRATPISREILLHQTSTCRPPNCHQ